jgi:hypothetical protein
VPFTEIFGCVQTPPSLIPRPAQAPLARTIHQVQNESAKRHDYKHAGEEHQCREHLLHEINLQSNECHKADP